MIMIPPHTQKNSEYEMQVVVRNNWQPAPNVRGSKDDGPVVFSQKSVLILEILKTFLKLKMFPEGKYFANFLIQQHGCI